MEKDFGFTLEVVLKGSGEDEEEMSITAQSKMNDLIKSMKDLGADVAQSEGPVELGE